MFSWHNDRWELALENECIYREGRWYKTYLATNMSILACEIITTKFMQDLPGIVKNRLEYCKFSDCVVEIQVSTEGFDQLVEGKMYSKDEIQPLISGFASLEFIGLVHGDIKPANIVMTPKGLAMIDFSYMTSIGNTLVETHGYKNDNAIAHSEGILQKVDPIASALYAFGVTLAHITDDPDLLTLASECMLGKKQSFLDLIPRIDFGEPAPLPISSYHYTLDISNRHFFSPRSAGMITFSYSPENNIENPRERYDSFDYSLLNGIANVSHWYEKWIENELSLVTLVVFLRMLLDGDNDPSIFGIGNFTPKTMEIMRNPDWVTYYPICSGKFLTLGFISLIETGAWKSCNKNGQWGENISDEIPDTKMKAIMLATDHLDFVIRDDLPCRAFSEEKAEASTDHLDFIIRDDLPCRAFSEEKAEASTDHLDFIIRDDLPCRAFSEEKAEASTDHLDFIIRDDLPCRAFSEEKAEASTDHLDFIIRDDLPCRAFSEEKAEASTDHLDFIIRDDLPCRAFSEEKAEASTDHLDFVIHINDDSK